ncbi:DNA adenine methylase [Aestuariivirga sp.]|uniref:DNA adenine methylase n=1 Tax=Aestuariivirga sp. TaxID=2650926 RepID=UPI0039E5256D
MIVPFLKWPGGKRWLVQDYPEAFPRVAGTYYEPFLGAGAAFFLTEPSAAHLSDANAELINVYKQIRRAPLKFAKALAVYHSKHDKAFYYRERAQNYACNFRRSVQFVYQNRTCFNGIYRVNLDGQFNVPIGTKNAVVLPSDDFLAVARLLRGKTLAVEDYSTAIAKAGKNDFIFADPPYTVKHNLNGFVKYNDKLFQWSDQEKLRASLEAASRRGARIVVSNANHESVRALYSRGWHLNVVCRSTVISSDPGKRGETTELLISNFPLKLAQVRNDHLFKSPGRSNGFVASN